MDLNFYTGGNPPRHPFVYDGNQNHGQIPTQLQNHGQIPTQLRQQDLFPNGMPSSVAIAADLSLNLFEDIENRRKMSENASSRSRKATAEKPLQVYECSICNRKFKKLFLLSSHLKIHDPSKNYQCTHCPLKFSRYHDLLRHAKIHLDHKPFVCERCGKAFSRKDTLKRHIKMTGKMLSIYCKPNVVTGDANVEDPKAMENVSEPYESLDSLDSVGLGSGENFLGVPQDPQDSFIASLNSNTSSNHYHPSIAGMARSIMTQPLRDQRENAWNYTAADSIELPEVTFNNPSRADAFKVLSASQLSSIMSKDQAAEAVKSLQSSAKLADFLSFPL